MLTPDDRPPTPAPPANGRPPNPIPPPEIVRERLTRALREVALLRSQLRVSERAQRQEVANV